ncbi:MAG: hypothetical protein PHR77_13610 [Kiritimatiellae bacterium]|nr:hypothetical protein [Kiritimatiellia bacterium]MDD5520739.1 hypothetical protein [Kiritimatiellia bacterium]
MDKLLNIKIELVKRDWKHRDLASQLREHGFSEVDTADVSRLIAGRWTPPEDIRRAIADILERPTFELFGGKIQTGEMKPEFKTEGIKPDFRSRRPGL